MESTSTTKTVTNGLVNLFNVFYRCEEMQYHNITLRCINLSFSSNKYIYYNVNLKHKRSYSSFAILLLLLKCEINFCSQSFDERKLKFTLHSQISFKCILLISFSRTCPGVGASQGHGCSINKD